MGESGLGGVFILFYITRETQEFLEHKRIKFQHCSICVAQGCRRPPRLEGVRACWGGTAGVGLFSASSKSFELGHVLFLSWFDVGGFFFHFFIFFFIFIFSFFSFQEFHFF